MNVSLHGLDDTCDYAITMDSKQVEGMREFTTLTIRSKILCTITGRKESLMVSFTRPSLFKNANGETMQVAQVAIALHKAKYLSESAKAVVETSGSVFEGANIGMLLLSVGLLLLQ